MPNLGEPTKGHVAGRLSGDQERDLADYNFSSKTFEKDDLKKIFKDFIEKEAALTSDSKCRYLDKNGVEKGILSEDIISKINGLLDRLDDNGVSFRSLERLPDLAIVTKDGASVNLKDIFSKGCQILENNEVIKEYKNNIVRLPQEERANLGIANRIGGGDVLREIEDILVRESSKESLLDTYKSVCALMRELNDVRNDQSKPHKNQLDEENSKSLIDAISAKLKAAKNIPEGAINILDKHFLEKARSMIAESQESQEINETPQYVTQIEEVVTYLKELEEKKVSFYTGETDSNAMIYVHGVLKGEDLLIIGYTIGDGPYAKGFSEEIDLSKLKENFSDLANDRDLISAIEYLHNKLKSKD